MRILVAALLTILGGSSNVFASSTGALPNCAQLRATFLVPYSLVKDYECDIQASTIREIEQPLKEGRSGYEAGVDILIKDTCIQKIADTNGISEVKLSEDIAYFAFISPGRKMRCFTPYQRVIGIFAID